MHDHDATIKSRRAFLQSAGAVAAGLIVGGLPRQAHAIAAPLAGRMKIGVIGSGRIGGTVGSLWIKAGHAVLFSSRHPDRLKSLVEPLGPRAEAGSPKAAAAYGQVVLISVPYAAVPRIGHDFARELAGKIVLETGNPYPRRDGEMATAARNKGTGRASAEFLPGVRLVRAFNTVGHNSLRSEAHRKGEHVGIPLAGDDKEALAVAARLVRDAGFEPVIVGTLARAKEFDVGTAVYGKALTARVIRQRLGLSK